MGCNGWYYGYGNYWHWGNLIISIVIIVVIIWALSRILGSFSHKHIGSLSSFNNFVNNKAVNCPNCRTAIEESYLRCPECNHKLKDNCPSCGKIVKTSWSVCPYCETQLK